MARYDTVIIGGTAVLPGSGAARCDLGIRSGRIAEIAAELSTGDGEEAIDARGLHLVPGAVDSHAHLGIYRPVDADAETETASSLVGGATSMISYFRTGQHYLNKVGPYREILPELLHLARDKSYVDLGFHLAPMTREQLSEIDWLVGEAGVTSFKYYFFYKGLNLAADSTDAAAYTMSDQYDFGHLYAMMEQVRAADREYGARGRISLSLHCEDAELIKLFVERIRGTGLPPLEEYAKARPPLCERLSIHEAGVMADSTRVRVNLLHLSSGEAIRAAREVRMLYPEVDLRLETTVHHLALTYRALEGKGLGGKVNPPIRDQDDVESLWGAIADGTLQWVASDHACCLEELKGDELWPAQPGFGGTALIYPALVSEGVHRRGLPLERIVDLVSAAPARAYGCFPRKGALMVGADADVVLLDLTKEQVVTPDILHSAQDHTPFEGVTVTGWPARTMLRGQTMFRDGEIVSPPAGEYLVRPLARPEPIAA